MRSFLFISSIIVLISCNSNRVAKNEQKKPEEKLQVPKLELVWASDSLLRTPESVFFDKERQLLYVSNVNQNPWEKDGDGFITKMDLSGNIIELRWIEALSSPTGMGVNGNFLYIADTDEIVKVDLETSTIVERIKMNGKPNLNDITVGNDGLVYVTGSATNTIYEIKDDKVSEFLVGAEESYNGLYWEKDRLLLLTSGSSLFKTINWTTREVSILSENMEAGDGIVALGDGSYLTSSWAGAIFHVTSEGKVSKILDTEAIKENAADFDYSVNDNLLFVPTFFDNRVKAYKLIF